MLGCQKVSQEANKLHVKFEYTLQEHNVGRHYSPEYACGALNTMFAFSQSKHVQRNSYNYSITVSVRFKKILDNDDSIYTCELISPKEDLLVNKLRICDDHWIQITYVIGDSNESSYVFEITLNCEIDENQSIFASIYDDTESADFKLSGENGSVQFHKTILAAHSPVFQKMLAGEWKESQEGSVALQDVSLETLQHLKDYMYLNRLPATSLQELCLLASYCMMPRLVAQCCAKLINHLVINDMIEMIEFASRHRLRNLLIALLKIIVHNDKIDKLEGKTKGWAF